MAPFEASALTSAKNCQMFRNYLKTAFRNLIKSKFYTSINIIGLAVGLATCLLILLYVLDELSFDKYNTRADRIYRVNNEIKFGNNYIDLAVCAALQGSTMAREIPQVEQYTRIRWYGAFLVKKGMKMCGKAGLVLPTPLYLMYLHCR